MKKILYTATSDIHLRTFHFPYLKWLINEGYEVHVAIENRADIDLSFCHKVYYLPFKRSPFSKDNWFSYKRLRQIIRENNYSLVHCHTPTVSVISRLAARNHRKQGLKVLYTAHGYHFYKGSPLKFWLVYYLVEKLLSSITDGIILINKEDYLLTKNKFWNKHTFYLKGIGIDNTRFPLASNAILDKIRDEIGLTKDDFSLLYIAEFISRKNHEFLIRATEELIKVVPNAKLVFAGKGELLEKIKTLTKELNLERYVHFLGWRDDIAFLAQISHLGISASKQEGLGLGLAEEMYFKLPIVATLDRGHKEMIEHGVNGFMFSHGNTKEFVGFVKTLAENKDLYDSFSCSAYEKSQEFMLENSLRKMSEIYMQFL